MGAQDAGKTFIQISSKQGFSNLNIEYFYILAHQE